MSVVSMNEITENRSGIPQASLKKYPFYLDGLINIFEYDNDTGRYYKIK